MKTDKQATRGFTLIEMVIVTVVVSILAAVLAPLAYTSLRAYDTTLGNVVVLDKLRYATERLAREIREVNYVSVAGFAFTSRGANSMAFTRTYFDAAGTESADTLVTIGNTGTAVTLQYSLPVVVEAPVLTDELGGTAGTPSGNLAFSYFQADGATAATSNTDVRSVEISLTLRHNDNDYTQRTRVELKRYAGS